MIWEAVLADLIVKGFCLLAGVFGFTPKLEFRVFPDLYHGDKTLNLHVWNKPLLRGRGRDIDAGASVRLVDEIGKEVSFQDLLWSTGTGDFTHMKLAVDEKNYYTLQVLRVQKARVWVPSPLAGTRTIPNGTYQVAVTLKYDNTSTTIDFPQKWRIPELVAV